jgi:hypothetical protein
MGNWHGYFPYQKFDVVFGVTAFGNKTLLQVLGTGGGGKFALGRHAVAALLNAANPNVDYEYTTAQVIAIVRQAFAGGDYESAKNRLAGENESTCPLDRPCQRHHRPGTRCRNRDHDHNDNNRCDLEDRSDNDHRGNGSGRGNGNGHGGFGHGGGYGNRW